MDGDKTVNSGADPAPTQDPAPAPEGKQQEKTYSQSQVDKLLDDQRASFEKKVTEAEKLAGMTAKEKAEYEEQQRESKLAERERAVELKELKQTAADALREKGLDAELAKILDYTDADAVNKSIKTVEKVFNEAVERAVKEKLGASSKVPKTGSTSQAVSGVEAAFYKLNPRLKK